MRQYAGMTWVAVVVMVGGMGAGCGASDMSSGGRIGVTPGGAQDAGYFRAKLASGVVPLATDITVEGFLGEHDLQFPEPVCGQVLCLHALVGNDRAVAEGGHATFVALAMATNVDLDARARMPVNMAVVVDVSGSMAEAGKLEYVKQGLLTMLDSLGAEDRLALVTYSTEAQVKLASALLGDKTELAAAIDGLAPNGSTNLYDGMVLGYEQVLAHLDPSSLPRVMLLSDGLTNTGVADPEIIVETSAEYNAQGIGITTIGVGLDFNQDLMRTLAEQGGGNFYFIEDPAKTATVFQDELDFLVTPLADDLVITISLGDGFSLVETSGISYTQNESGALVLRVPTVFASKHGGAMLIRVDAADNLIAHVGEVVTGIHYMYRPVSDDGALLEAEAQVTDARLPDLAEEESRAYTSQGVAKAIVLWNMAKSFQQASNLYHRSADRSAALAQVEALAAYADEANAVLHDDEIARDQVELIDRFAVNLGGISYDNMHECTTPMPCAATPGDKLPAFLCLVTLRLIRLRDQRRARRRDAEIVVAWT